jgi:hypothetical protein
LAAEGNLDDKNLSGFLAKALAMNDKDNVKLADNIARISGLAM